MQVRGTETDAVGKVELLESNKDPITMLERQQKLEGQVPGLHHIWANNNKEKWL